MSNHNPSNQDQGRESARGERPQPRSEASSKRKPGAKARNARKETRAARTEVIDARHRAVVRAQADSGRPSTPRKQRGPHTGRGPKGYRRDDRRIRADICDRLLADSNVDAREIEVNVERGQVRLDGTVVNRVTKRYVECIGVECLGVTDVQNNLRVREAKHAAKTSFAGPTERGDAPVSGSQSSAVRT